MRRPVPLPPSHISVASELPERAVSLGAVYPERRLDADAVDSQLNRATAEVIDNSLRNNRCQDFFSLARTTAETNFLNEGVSSAGALQNLRSLLRHQRVRIVSRLPPFPVELRRTTGGYPRLGRGPHRQPSFDGLLAWSSPTKADLSKDDLCFEGATLLPGSPPPAGCPLCAARDHRPRAASVQSSVPSTTSKALCMRLTFRHCGELVQASNDRARRNAASHQCSFSERTFFLSGFFFLSRDSSPRLP